RSRSLPDARQQSDAEKKDCNPRRRATRGRGISRGPRRRGNRGCDRIAANAESIRDAIDIVEPRRDEGDLQNALVVEAGRAQFIDVAGLQSVASFVTFTT